MNVNEAENRLSISYYKEIATLNKEHHISIVQHIGSNKIYVKKTLGVYNSTVYAFIKEHPINGIPNIVDVYDDGTRLTVIEEYISGYSLLEMSNADHIFTIVEIVSIVTKLCNIVASLHDLNPPIIHRDIKPSNVIVSTEGDVYLIDLNAAKFFDETKSEDTALLGTQGYAAPEQYGFGSSSVKTDIYAVGALISHLLSLCEEKNTIEANRLYQVADKCMQIDPRKRYNSVSMLKSALIRIIDPTVKTAQNYNSWMIPGFRSRSPIKMFIAVLCYLIIAWLSFTLKDNNQTTIAIIVYERVFFFISLLSVVFFVCNYKGIRQKLPLSSSPNPYVRIISTIMYSIVLLFSLLFIMLLIESIFI
ncbi:MAG: protein kinase [Lachnospiraceae bacterium]|nr:protein kinase [Lachnospiraceae bacterium]